MTFIPNTPKEKNNYKLAFRNALAALADGKLAWYVVTDADLGRKTAHSPQSVVQGMQKLIDAGKLPIVVAKGTDSDTDKTVVAIRKA